jgi:hypothetical protein
LIEKPPLYLGGGLRCEKYYFFLGFGLDEYYSFSNIIIARGKIDKNEEWMNILTQGIEGI